MSEVMAGWGATRLPGRAFLMLEVGACLLGLTAIGWATTLPPSPQYVNISGLPGGGQPLDPLGRATGEGPGAVQLNIPIAFTPSRGYWSAGVWAGRFVPPFDRASEPGNPFARGDSMNGSGLVSAGIGTPGHGVYVGDFIKSRVLDQAYNLQWEAAHSTAGRMGVAIGIQDIGDAEEGARSPYIVGSKVFTESSLSPALTLGYGGGRFGRRIFAGLSYKMNKRTYGTVEYDGFQYNGGFVLQIWQDRSLLANLTLAANHGDCPLIGLSLARRQQ